MILQPCDELQTFFHYCLQQVIIMEMAMVSPVVETGSSNNSSKEEAWWTQWVWLVWEYLEWCLRDSTMTWWEDSIQEVMILIWLWEWVWVCFHHPLWTCLSRKQSFWRIQHCFHHHQVSVLWSSPFPNYLNTKVLITHDTWVLYHTVTT